jgi:hypothetical protein
MEAEVDKQVAAPAETRTPTLHRAQQSLTEECGWKGGDRVGLGAEEEEEEERPRIPKRLSLSFLAEW